LKVLYKKLALIALAGEMEHDRRGELVDFLWLLRLESELKL
jgi:hypothetical protein